MHRRTRQLIGLVVLGLLVTSACSGDDSGDGGSKKAGNSTKLTLEGPTWVLAPSPSLGASINGLVVSARFVDGRVSGDNGCNSYSGSYTLDGSTLTIGSNLVTTLVGCTGSAATVEQTYMARLHRTRSYEISGDRLSLLDASGKDLLGYTASGDADLTGTWRATSYYTGNAIQSVAGGTELTAKFTTDAVSGNSGCNTYSGSVTTSGDDDITIGPLASTRRACIDQAVSDQEQQYLAALELASTYRVTGPRLELFRADGGIAATFERAS